MTRTQAIHSVGILSEPSFNPRINSEGVASCAGGDKKDQNPNDELALTTILFAVLGAEDRVKR